MRLDQLLERLCRLLDRDLLQVTGKDALLLGDGIIMVLRHQGRNGHEPFLHHADVGLAQRRLSGVRAGLERDYKVMFPEVLRPDRDHLLRRCASAFGLDGDRDLDTEVLDDVGDELEALVPARSDVFQRGLQGPACHLHLRHGVVAGLPFQRLRGVEGGGEAILLEFLLLQVTERDQVLLARYGDDDPFMAACGLGQRLPRRVEADSRYFTLLVGSAHDQVAEVASVRALLHLLPHRASRLERTRHEQGVENVEHLDQGIDGVDEGKEPLTRRVLGGDRARNQAVPGTAGDVRAEAQFQRFRRRAGETAMAYHIVDIVRRLQVIDLHRLLPDTVPLLHRVRGEPVPYFLVVLVELVELRNRLLPNLAHGRKVGLPEGGLQVGAF